jgi:predicted enzyme related to lactoylglutathione lyase
MPNPIAHFDIRAEDLAAARRFYERVFGWTFEAWGPPDFFMIWTGPAHEPGAVHGSLSKRYEPRTAAESHGWECTISVEDLGGTRTAILAHGGKVLREDEEIVGVGTLIQFADPDGNVACAMQYVTRQ